MLENIDARIKQFVMIRDMKRALEAKFNEDKKPLQVALDALSGHLLKFLDENGGKAFASPHGTVYSSKRKTASLADASAFMDFVINNKLFDLIDRRANATAVGDYIDKYKQLPPGCNYSVEKTIGVKRGKDDDTDA